MPEMTADVVDERHQGAGVGAIRNKGMRNGDLTRGIDGDLPALALHEGIAPGHDQTVCVRKVALWSVWRTPVHSS